jgi:excisionase family DNA binding protein
MPKLSIRQAARQARVSRSTLLRAIQTGKMSAHRKEDGDGYLIEPSELFRVFEPRPPCPSDTGHPVEDHDGQGVDEPDGQGGQGPTVLHIRLARMEERVKSLETVLELERRRAEEDRQRAEKRADELRQERDAWRGQAEAAQRQLVDLTGRSRKGLRRWLGLG